MSYSIKKAGVAFKLKLGTNVDLTGEAANFAAYYIADATGIKTDIVTAFTEDVNTAGLYMVEVTIPVSGDYTMVINNSNIGMGNHESPLVVVDATIDDVKIVVDALQTTLSTVAADVDGLNGESLLAVKNEVQAVKDLISKSGAQNLTVIGDQTLNYINGSLVTGDTSGATGTVTSSTYDIGSDTTTIVIEDAVGVYAAGELLDGVDSVVTVKNITDSVLEFVEQINVALDNGGAGLSALAGYTDDIENMLTGTEFLADGTTSNPFYDVTNPGVAKESSLAATLASLQGDLTAQTTSLESSITAAKDLVIIRTDAIKAVVDANQANLENAGYGLLALKNLIDGVSTDVGIAETNILNVLNDASNGLIAIKTDLLARFDSVDAKLLTIEGKVEAGSNITEFKVFA